MECLSCGLPSGYNRVLVEQGNGAEVAGLCVECEARRFEGRLRRQERSETDGCALCTGNAHVRVPEWDPEMDVLSDGTVVWEDYRVTGTTPGICEEHFGTLTERGSETEASRQTHPRP